MLHCNPRGKVKDVARAYENKSISLTFLMFQTKFYGTNNYVSITYAKTYLDHFSKKLFRLRRIYVPYPRANP